MKKVALAVLFMGSTVVAFSQQSRESAAVDPTATQWSYQFAYEQFFDYKNDILESGMMRPDGRQRFGQFRLVAPIPKGKLPFTLLPRLTLRYQQQPESAGNDWGFASSDLFVLGIINDWGTGRWGVGPQINFPSQQGFGNTNWGLGLAGAVTQRYFNDKLFLALLLQQAWTSAPDGGTVGNPLVINPVIVYQLGKGWYVGNGDFVIQYNWLDKSWFFPIGLRFGKAFISEKNTRLMHMWNGLPVAQPGQIGKAPVASNAFRVNIQWQIPVRL
jgi:hypothetical protein